MGLKQLEDDWSSIHDITSNKIIFITVNGEEHWPISDSGHLKKDVGTIRGNGGRVAFSKDCKLFSNIDFWFDFDTGSAYSHGEAIERYGRPIQYEKRWREKQSLGVSSIIKALKTVSELQVPCLYFEIVDSDYGFTVPISSNHEEKFSFYKNFKKLLSDMEDSFQKIRSFSKSLNKNREKIPHKKIRNSFLWIKKWVEIRADLSVQISGFIQNTFEGKAGVKDVYKSICPLRSQLEPREFNTLRTHLNRLTASNPEYLAEVIASPTVTSEAGLPWPQLIV